MSKPISQIRSNQLQSTMTFLPLSSYYFHKFYHHSNRNEEKNEENVSSDKMEWEVKIEIRMELYMKYDRHEQFLMMKISNRWECDISGINVVLCTSLSSSLQENFYATWSLPIFLWMEELFLKVVENWGTKPEKIDELSMNKGKICT